MGPAAGYRYGVERWPLRFSTLINISPDGLFREVKMNGQVAIGT